MAPPSAASDHFTSGESKNDGIDSSDQASTRKLGCEGGIFGADRASRKYAAGEMPKALNYWDFLRMG